MMSVSWSELANPEVRTLTPYEPGKPIEELERELGITGAIKLASNENPFPPSPAVLAALREALPSLNRYPDGSGFSLREALAKRHGISSDQVLLGNGSNELIELLLRVFMRPGEEVIMPTPSFVVYPLITQGAGGTKVEVPLREWRLDLSGMTRAITKRTRLIFIANPNNPTGTIVTADEVRQFMDEVPERIIVVFDEAYYEFAQGPDFPESVAYLREDRKVVVLRTFSKIASLAGLRIGYALAAVECVGLLNRIRQPFNVNSLAQVAALAAVEDEEHTRRSIAVVEKGKQDLYRQFRALGLTYVPTRANFILVQVPDAASIYPALLREGVIVRPMGGAGLRGALRVTIGTPEENARLIAALRRVLRAGSQ